MLMLFFAASHVLAVCKTAHQRSLNPDISKANINIGQSIIFIVFSIISLLLYCPLCWVW